MNKKAFYSTAELAKILGISRVAVFQQIKDGKIPAMKVGRSYIVDAKDVPHVSGGALRDADRRMIHTSVQRTVKEYGETLKLLGTE